MTLFEFIAGFIFAALDAAGDLRSTVLQVDAAFAAAKEEVTQWLK